MDTAKKKHPTVGDLYDRYADTLYRLAFSILVSKEDAEDAVHDVFEKYIFGAPDFLEPEHEKAWFLRVTVNQCRDLLRKKKVRTHLPLEEAAELASPQKESVGVFQKVLALPEKYKTVILLHYFEGYGIAETASILKLTCSAVKMRLARGRDLLRLELGGDDDDAG